MVTEYIENSLRRDGPEMNSICQCAASNNVSVVLGYPENDNHSLYLSQCIIGRDGKSRCTGAKLSLRTLSALSLATAAVPH